MTHFVFCHGFGFDASFWERIAPYFSQEKCSFIDLGYFNNRVDIQCLQEQRIVAIGHSIGLSKLISTYSFDYLIGLNGFINFLGSDLAIYTADTSKVDRKMSGELAQRTLVREHKRIPKFDASNLKVSAVYQKRLKELKALRSSFLKDAKTTLRNFYSRCGTPELIECTDFSKLDLDLILSDFDWLQKEYKLPEVPTLILSSDDDMVLPHTITSDNFSKHPHIKIDSITNAGHALGFRKPLEVYEKIMSFLNRLTNFDDKITN